MVSEGKVVKIQWVWHLDFLGTAKWDSAVLAWWHQCLALVNPGKCFWLPNSHDKLKHLMLLWVPVMCICSECCHGCSHGHPGAREEQWGFLGFVLEDMVGEAATSMMQM